MHNYPAQSEYHTPLSLLPWRSLPLAVAAALVLFALAPSCSILKAAFGGSDAIEALGALPEPEWILWRNKAVLEVKITAQASVEEKAIKRDDLEAIASVLTVIGGSNTVEAGKLTEWLELSGYKAALLQLAILELDSKLIAGGLYEDGLLGPRGKELLIHLGAALQEVAVETS